MKFVRLTMKNFMRYKGTNTINFSCDSEKNVTVVLGDNTIGKTTIAQAFRWGLYGELIDTQYDKSKKVSILNNEILGDMTANDRANVEVELMLENINPQGVKYEYKIVRKSDFVRKFPQFVAVEKAQSLKLYMKDTETGKSTPYDNTNGKVDELISELLPKNLSPYFLFDGERWSDERSTKNDIKDSIYNLVGISPIKEMKRHLGECGTQGRTSVIKTLKGKITGSGTEYTDLEKNIENYLDRIATEEKKIEDAEKNAAYYTEEAEKKNELLRANPNVENDQKEYERLKNEIAKGEDRKKNIYADIVMSFSESFTYFAAPLLQDIVDILKNVDLEGVDIPGVTDQTILYLLNKGECLCGHKIEHGSKEEDYLKHLIEVVPPAVIGKLVGNFQDKIASWDYKGGELFERIQDKAKLYQEEEYILQDNEEELERKERKIDRKVNFSHERAKMNNYNRQARAEMEKSRLAQLNIDDLKARIAKCEKEKDTLKEKTEANRKLERYIAYAEELYKSVSTIYQNKESSLLDELNEIIEKNFREMFNEQEKVARLGDDYKLRLFYKRVNNSVGYSDLEATGLSEGEKIARNFAFIVSILELANQKKAAGDEVAQSLPLVLDGPFSKLSAINTSKVAKVLPAVSEQVIIFMLDKDWEPSGLERYTDKKYMYRTTKDIDGNSSAICQEA